MACGLRWLAAKQSRTPSVELVLLFFLVEEMTQYVAHESAFAPPTASRMPMSSLHNLDPNNAFAGSGGSAKFAIAFYPPKQTVSLTLL